MMELHLRGDSSASHGTLQRLGSGRVKHLQTRQLWLQEKVYAGEVSVEKIARKINWADSLTHAWTVAEEGHFEEMGIRSRPEEVRGECLQRLATETGSTERRACTTETPESCGQSSRTNPTSPNHHPCRIAPDVGRYTLDPTRQWRGPPPPLGPIASTR